MTCPNCGTELEKGTPQCPQCGTRFMRGKYCPHCHAVMLATASVCPQCGRDVNEERKVSSFRWWRIPIYILCVILGFVAAVVLMKMTTLLSFLDSDEAPSGSLVSTVSAPESSGISEPEVSDTAFFDVREYLENPDMSKADVPMQRMLETGGKFPEADYTMERPE